MRLTKKRKLGTSRVAKVSINAGVLIAAKIFTSGISFFLAIVINRQLGAVNAGIYTYAFTMYSIFMIVPDFGFGSISVRDVSQDHTKMSAYFRNIVSMRMVLGLGACLILLATDFGTALTKSPIAFDQKFWAIFAIAFCLLIEQPFSNTLAECFVAMERLTVVAYVYLIMAILKVALSLYVILAGINPVLVLLIVIYIITILYSIVHFYLLYRRMLRRDIQPEIEQQQVALAEAVIHAPELPEGPAFDQALLADFSYATVDEPEVEDKAAGGPGERGRFAFLERLKLDEGLWRYLFRSAWPLALVAIGISVYAYMDIPILSWIKGDAQVGLYNAGVMFAKSLIYLGMGINLAVLPAISVVAKRHPERLGDIWERFLRFMFTLVIIVAVLVPILARPILVLQKHDFIAAWPVVWLTMAAMTFTALTGISFPFFVVLDKQKKATVVVAIGIAVKLVFLLIAIPLWGYNGAAIALLASEVISFFLYYAALSPELNRRIQWLRTFVVPLLCLGVLYAASFVVMWFLIHGNASADKFLGSLVYAVIAAAVVTVVFAAMVLLTRLISRKNLRELNALLKVEQT
jgi:O-antigen/teichoic acid export membrane protein